MIITLGFLCEEHACSEVELAHLDQLFREVRAIVSSSVDELTKSMPIELRVIARVSNAVEASLFRKEFACLLVQPLTADRILVEIPSGAASPGLAAELLADRADILVVAARTADQAEITARRVLSRGRDSGPEVAGICNHPASILGIYDTADAGRQLRPIEHLRLTVASLARQDRAALAITEREQPREPGWTLGGIFPLLFQLKTSQFKIHHFQAHSYKELSWPKDAPVLLGDDFAKLEEIRTQLVFPFTAADQIAIYYGNLFRTVGILILVLHLSAVIMALVSLQTENAGPLPILEVIALCVALTLFFWGRARKLLRNWVDYRLLAELIRPAPHFMVLGRFFNLRAPDMSPESLHAWRGVVRRYRDVIGTVNWPPIVFTNQYIYGTLHVLRSFIEGQVKWQRGFARQHETIHRRLVRAAGISFIIVLLTALGHAIKNLLPPKAPYWVSIPVQWLTPSLVLWIAILVPMIGFAIGIIVHQLGFEQIAERSEGAADRLDGILRSIDAHHGPITLEHVHHWAEQCEQAVAEEQSSWYRQTTRIGFHL